MTCLRVKKDYGHKEITLLSKTGAEDSCLFKIEGAVSFQTTQDFLGYDENHWNIAEMAETRTLQFLNFCE